MFQCLDGTANGSFWYMRQKKNASRESTKNYQSSIDKCMMSRKRDGEKFSAVHKKTVFCWEQFFFVCLLPLEEGKKCEEIYEKRKQNSCCFKFLNFYSPLLHKYGHENIQKWPLDNNWNSNNKISLHFPSHAQCFCTW